MIILSTDFCFFICSLMMAFCCLIYYYTHKKPQKARSSVFVLMIFNLMLTALSACVANAMDPFTRPGGSLANTVQEFAQTVYFALHALLAPLFALYVVLVNNWGEKRPRIDFLIFLLPAALLEIPILSNPLTKIIFYYENDVAYRRGPLELLVYALAVGYFAFAIRELLEYRKVLLRRTAFALWFFICCSVFGVLVQLVFTWFKVELFFESLSLFGLMLLVEMEDYRIDSPSGVYNRQTFLLDMDRSIRTKRRCSVLLITFTNLKIYRRMLSIQDMEDLVRSQMYWIIDKARGTVYRVDQNRVAIVSAVGKDDSAMKSFASAFRKRLSEFKDCYGGMNVTLSATVDTVRIPDEIDSAELLTELGDGCERTIKPGVEIRVEGVGKALGRMADVERVLQRAIQERSFEVHYQPIWNSEISSFDCAEALVRLTRTELGDISPVEFIPIAERNGMIHEIGDIVFEKVCQFLSESDPMRYGIKYIDVNISVYQLYAENTEIRFREILDRYGIDPAKINLEITESASMNGGAFVLENFERLKNVGFSFSLDDFGSGYSNLSFVVSHYFKKIKSDKGLLVNSKDGDARKLLAETIGVMRKLQMEVIQEGVETKDDLDLVVNAGANKIQGFYFSKALEGAAFLEFVRSRNRKASG